MNKFSLKFSVFQEIAFGLTSAYLFKKHILNKYSDIFSDISENQDKSFHLADEKRLLYYGTLSLLYLESYSFLTKTSISEKQKELFALIGFLTPLFDDFYDNSDMASAKLTTIIHSPDYFEPKTIKEKTILRLYKRVTELTYSPDLIEEIYEPVFFGQELSRRQINNSLNYKQLLNITYQKGGSSFVFLRELMEPVCTEKEKTALFLIGGLFQLESDLFDLYKDYVANISTIPLLVNNWKVFRIKYYKESVRSLKRFSTGTRKEKRFLIRMSLILARGMVMIDMLEHLQIKNGGTFEIQKLHRKDLICDMEKPRNFLKMISYSEDFLRFVI